MRRLLIAGNWKMNGLSAQLAVATAVAQGVETYVAEGEETGQALPPEVLICPPATLLAALSATLRNTSLRTGGQDCHAASSGAHTGDLSAVMLADAGASYVIVGHSERRADHSETSAIVRAKAEAAAAAGLVPILCVGETEAERDSGAAVRIVCDQLIASLPPPETITGNALVIAYEPVWAIGSGRTPTLSQVQDMHAALRARLGETVGQEASRVRLLYGGSMKPQNAHDLLALHDVDGGLIGGASLNADEFLAIIAAARASLTL